MKLTLVRALTVGGAALSLLVAHASAAIVFSNGSPSPSLTPIGNTLVNFDELPTNSVLSPTQYAAVGIASIVNLQTPPLGVYQGTQSQPNYVGTGPNVGWAADIMITFSSLQSQIGIGVADDTTTFKVWGDNNTLLGTHVNAGLNFYQIISSNAADIRAIQITSAFVAIDDIQFTGGRVPDSGLSVILLGMGLAGLAVIRRKLN
ncbi:MAG: VPDSG-CTERM sorting domain-containing protein [Opitutaceae bacterium]|nr:VPDSG-CTERM sorting domain-containing protein [Opitutaceae bacterium]